MPFSGKFADTDGEVTLGRRFVAWLFALVVLPEFVSAQQVLHLKARRRLPGTSVSRPTQEIAEIDTPAPSRREHLILQFDNPPTRVMAARLSERGVRVLGDVPENGLLVSLDRRVDLRGLAVRAQTPLEPRDKLSPLISAGRPPTRRPFFVVEFHGDADMNRARTDLVNLGLEVREHPDLLANHILVRVPPGNADRKSTRLNSSH